MAQVPTEGSKVVHMPPGDYIVHIHVQKGKDFEMDGEDVCDP
jgi:DnaJ-class molecular chaperone